MPNEIAMSSHTTSLAAAMKDSYPTYIPISWEKLNGVPMSVVSTSPTLKGTSRSGSSYTRLKDTQPIAGVMVTYDQDTTKTVEALSDYGASALDAQTGGTRTGYSVLNRYAYGSGRFRWRPSYGLDRTFAVLDYKTQLTTQAEKPWKDDASRPQQIYIGDDNEDKAGAYQAGWRTYARETHGDFYGFGNMWTSFDLEPQGGSDDLLAQGSSPLDSLTAYTYPLNNRFKDDKSPGSVLESKEATSIELYFPVNGLMYSDLVDGASGEGFLWLDHHNWMRPQFDNYLIAGIQIEASSTTNNPANTSTFSSTPFKYASQKEDIANFNWSLKSAKHLFNYWDQVAYYGYEQTGSQYLPTQYVALSDINNPIYVPNTKLIDVFDSNSSPITKVLAWKDNLLMFTRSSTSLAVGRIPEKKELVNSEVGLPEQYRNTAQVMSDSVIFKNKESVLALVPTPGTDGATSVRVRDIANQVKFYMRELEEANTVDSVPQFDVTSITMNNKEYWLIYTIPGLNKTIIFKYDWSQYSWLVDEYDIILRDFMKLDSDTVIASDANGILYEFLSWTSADLLDRTARGWKDIIDHASDGDETSTEAIEWLWANDPEHLEDASHTYTKGDLSDFSGPWQDIIYNNDKLYETAATSKDSETLLTRVYGFSAKPISYEFELGARRPLMDTGISLDDTTVIMGNEGNTPVLNQQFSVVVDGHKLQDYTVDLSANASAIYAGSPQTKWSFGASRYSNTLTKHTKKIRKIANTIDLHIKGETPNKIFLDSILFRYRQSGRKNYSR